MSIHTQIDPILTSIVPPSHSSMQKTAIKTAGVNYVRQCN